MLEAFNNFDGIHLWPISRKNEGKLEEKPILREK